MGPVVEIEVFMQQLEAKGLMIAPGYLVKERLAEAALDKLQKTVLKKKALTFKEIEAAQLWGSISAKAAKVYAQKHAKPGEILETQKGKITVLKIITVAVLRLSKSRGIKWD